VSGAPFEALGVFGLVWAGIFGLLVGSFVNVLIHRLPRDESLVRPGSHCPACGAPIGALENVPVVSYLALGGRCRSCRAPISPRYPLVELANALLWIASYRAAPSWADFAAGAILSSLCLALAWIDADFQILPDVLTLPGTAAGLALAFLVRRLAFRDAALGAALGGGGLFLLGWLWSRLRRVEAMGLGDVKMLAMLGAFLGPAGVLAAVFFASILGSLAGLVLILARRGSLKSAIPFGVFLAIGGVAAYFFAPPLLDRYRALWPA
jgi:leader peptidase (prepilin peptidase)/N-methyltransferase